MLPLLLPALLRVAPLPTAADPGLLTLVVLGMPCPVTLGSGDDARWAAGTQDSGRLVLCIGARHRTTLPPGLVAPGRASDANGIGRVPLEGK